MTCNMCEQRTSQGDDEILSRIDSGEHIENISRDTRVSMAEGMRPMSNTDSD